MRKPIFTVTGAVLIPVFLIAYFPLFDFWCHHIEAHVTEAQKHNGAYINGYYALGVMVDLIALFAAALAVCSLASLLRRERDALYSLLYGAPALVVSLAVAGLYVWEFIGEHTA